MTGAGATFRSDRASFTLQQGLSEILPAAPLLGLAGIVALLARAVLGGRACVLTRCSSERG